MKHYDVIVVGARCSGSPLAMLLARAGLKILLVDRMRFPSDILSTHTLQLAGLGLLQKWQCLHHFTDPGLRPYRDMSLDFGPFRIQGHPRPLGEIERTICCRRIVLDTFLQSQAIAAGAEFWSGCALESLETDGARVTGAIVQRGGGAREVLHAGLIVGADGMRSTVARLVGAVEYGYTSSKTFSFYGYWSGLPIERAELFLREGCVMAMVPTNDDATIVVVQQRIDRFDSFRRDADTNFMAAWGAVPRFHEMLRAGAQVERLRGAPHQHTFFRKPWGPGWALVGDAGCHKDSVTAQGITNAFFDADILSSAIVQSMRDERSVSEAMLQYERRRDVYLRPVVNRALELADLKYPEADALPMLERIAEQPDAVERFFGLDAGSVPFDEPVLAEIV